MRKWMRAITVLAVVVLVFAACGGGAEEVAEEMIEEGLEQEGGGDVDVEMSDGDVDIQMSDVDVDIQVSEDGDEFEFNIETDEGSASLSGSSEAPEGFPLPIPDGCEVLGSTSIDTTDGSAITVNMSVPLDDVDDVVELYKAEFESRGYETFVTTMDQPDGRVITVIAEGESLSAGLTMVVEGGEANASVMWIDPA